MWHWGKDTPGNSTAWLGWLGRGVIRKLVKREETGKLSRRFRSQRTSILFYFRKTLRGFIHA